MRTPFSLALFAAFTAVSIYAQTTWPQFGGPNRDFSIESSSLPATWPASGPKTLWKRPLGEGYSGIAVSGSLLYTMFNRGEEDVTVALDVKTGKQTWEHVSSRKTSQSMNYGAGRGPHMTPVVVGNRVFVVNTVGLMFALDTANGKVLWQKDLVRDLHLDLADRGFGPTPIAWNDTLLLPIGGPNRALVALRQSDGSLAWQRGDALRTFSSPVIVDTGGGKKEAVTFFGDKVAGQNPDKGDVAWSHPHSTDYDLNITTPTAGPDGVVVISSAYGGGAKGLQLVRENNQTSVKKLWEHKRLRLHHTNLVRIGDVVYGSSGDFGPAPMTAVNVKEGKILWQDRTFGKCNILNAGERALLLAEDGELAIVTLKPEGMTVLGKAQVATGTAWTAPAIANQVIYIRDRNDIQAVTLR